MCGIEDITLKYECKNVKLMWLLSNIICITIVGNIWYVHSLSYVQYEVTKYECKNIKQMWLISNMICITIVIFDMFIHYHMYDR